MIPAGTRRVIEVGCSSGALARAFKQTGDAHWVGVEIDPAYAEVAEQHCDYLEVENIEHCDSDFYRKYADRDCWVFGDCLEHLQDPWQVLSSIRKVIPRDGTVVACIPNAQHWSLVIKQALGAFFYEDSGLLDRTHLRWFSRLTMTQLFESQGFNITTLKPRIFDEPARETFLPSIIPSLKQRVWTRKWCFEIRCHCNMSCAQTPHEIPHCRALIVSAPFGRQ